MFGDAADEAAAIIVSQDIFPPVAGPPPLSFLTMRSFLPGTGVAGALDRPTVSLDFASSCSARNQDHDVFMRSNNLL